MSTVKITRSQIRDLLLEISSIEIENRGDTIASIVDEFVMTAPDDTTNLGLYGEEIVEKLMNGKNLNDPSFKRQNFPFADILVGDLKDIENAEIISVKSTSSLGSSVGKTDVNVIFKNSGVYMRRLQHMLNGYGRNGLRNEIMDGENPPRKLKISVVGVQPVVPRTKKFQKNISKEEGEKGLLHVLVVKYTKEFNVLINKENKKQPISLQGVNFSKVLRSHNAVTSVFGQGVVIGAYPTRARLTPAYYKRHRADLDIGVTADAASYRQMLLRQFRKQLRYLNNQQLQNTIRFAAGLNNVNKSVQESLIKECQSIIENRRLKNGCMPARRKISSGGKAGTYADKRTGGKQAHAALMKRKPPGTKGGYFKGAVCCHKCDNDRSAPNGYVCINPAHLCWGTKGDNTTDQHHGNGTACRTNEEKLRSDIKAMVWELIPEEVLKSRE